MLLRRGPKVMAENVHYSNEIVLGKFLLFLIKRCTKCFSFTLAKRLNISIGHRKYSDGISQFFSNR